MKARKLILAALFTLLGLGGFAQTTIIDQGTTGNLNWSLYVQGSDTVLTINGNDTMPDYYTWSGGTPWDAYKSNITTVIIGDSVTTIGRDAFRNCINLTSVTIGNNVTSIGASAFMQSVKLTSLTTPDSVTSIGNNAFQDCMSLISLVIGNNVTTIGREAFALCKSLTSVTIPNSVTRIGNSAFVWCYNLASVTLSNSLTKIEDVTFAWCTSLTSITLPNSVTSIGGDVFASCSSLATLTIGNGVTTIDDGAFKDCSGLISITTHAITPPIILFNINHAFRNVPNTIPIYIPCGTYNAYSTAWSYFSNFIEMGVSDTTFIFDTICQGKSYLFGSQHLSVSGIYYATQQNISGCDSIIELTLTVNPTYFMQISDSICTGSVYDFNGKLLTEEGVYYDSLQTIFGCDSIIKLMLTVTSVGITNYELPITNCVIYPNPTDGKLMMEIAGQARNDGIEIEIFDVVGRSVGAYCIRPDNNETTIDVSHLANGMYFLKIDNKKVVKIIKK